MVKEENKKSSRLVVFTVLLLLTAFFVTPKNIHTTYAQVPCADPSFNPDLPPCDPAPEPGVPDSQAPDGSAGSNSGPLSNEEYCAQTGLGCPDTPIQPPAGNTPIYQTERDSCLNNPNIPPGQKDTFCQNVIETCNSTNDATCQEILDKSLTQRGFGRSSGTSPPPQQNTDSSLDNQCKSICDVSNDQACEQRCKDNKDKDGNSIDQNHQEQQECQNIRSKPQSAWPAGINDLKTNPDSQDYNWNFFCGIRCNSNEDCAVNEKQTGVEAQNSNWCYRFSEAEGTGTCIQLRYTGGSNGTGPTPTPGRGTAVDTCTQEDQTIRVRSNQSCPAGTTGTCYCRRTCTAAGSSASADSQISCSQLDEGSCKNSNSCAFVDGQCVAFTGRDSCLGFNAAQCGQLRYKGCLMFQGECSYNCARTGTCPPTTGIEQPTVCNTYNYNSTGCSSTSRACKFCSGSGLCVSSSTESCPSSPTCDDLRGSLNNEFCNSRGCSYNPTTKRCYQWTPSCPPGRVCGASTYRGVLGDFDINTDNCACEDTSECVPLPGSTGNPGGGTPGAAAHPTPYPKGTQFESCSGKTDTDTTTVVEGNCSDKGLTGDYYYNDCSCKKDGSGYNPSTCHPNDPPYKACGPKQSSDPDQSKKEQYCQETENGKSRIGDPVPNFSSSTEGCKADCAPNAPAGVTCGGHQYCLYSPAGKNYPSQCMCEYSSDGKSCEGSDTVPKNKSSSPNTGGSEGGANRPTTAPVPTTADSGRVIKGRVFFDQSTDGKFRPGDLKYKDTANPITIKIKNNDTGKEDSTQIKGEEEYKFNNLDEGTYTVTIECGCTITNNPSRTVPRQGDSAGQNESDNIDFGIKPPESSGFNISGNKTTFLVGEPGLSFSGAQGVGRLLMFLYGGRGATRPTGDNVPRAECSDGDLLSQCKPYDPTAFDNDKKVFKIADSGGDTNSLSAPQLNPNNAPTAPGTYYAFITTKYRGATCSGIDNKLTNPGGNSNFTCKSDGVKEITVQDPSISSASINGNGSSRTVQFSGQGKSYTAYISKDQNPSDSAFANIVNYAGPSTSLQSNTLYEITANNNSAPFSPPTAAGTYYIIVMAHSQPQAWSQFDRACASNRNVYFSDNGTIKKVSPPRNCTANSIALSFTVNGTTGTTPAPTARQVAPTTRPPTTATQVPTPRTTTPACAAPTNSNGTYSCPTAGCVLRTTGSGNSTRRTCVRPASLNQPIQGIPILSGILNFFSALFNK